MDLGADIPITLIVKAPNQRIADHPVECMMGWTIRKLKEHLENVYPSKPRHNQQKLIYSGRLLDDHLTLQEVLRQNDAGSSHHTMHLVCAPTSEGYGSSLDSPSPCPQSSSSTQASAPPSAGPSSMAMPTSVPLNPLSQEGLRHRGYAMPQQQQAGVPPMMPMGTMPGFPYTAYHPQHLYYMQQQMYAQYMQYMQQYQMAAANLPATATLPNAPAPAPAAAAAANANAAAGNQNMRMNAQGGMVDEEDEDEMNRDWLDYLYIFFRFIVLVSIVYFYSNFSRFLAVCMGFFAFYMLQRLWPRVQEAQRAYLRGAQVVANEAEEAQEANAPANNAAAPPPHNNNDPAPSNNDPTANSSGASDSPASQSAEEEGTDETPVTNEQQQEEPKPNPFLVLYTFITTFFTSLIPEQPEPVHLN